MSNNNGTAIIRAIRTGWYDARIFGMISPNSSNRNVTITIFTTNSSPAAPANPTSESISPLDRITMQILTRLLTTRIVANRYSSADSNRRIALLLRSGLFFSRMTSRGEREKKAVSEAETDAETPSNRITISRITESCSVNGLNVTAWIKHAVKITDI